jgi:transposase
MTEINRTNHTTIPAPGKADSEQTAQHISREQEPLSRAEIAVRSASASTASERRRWQVIGMLAEGTSLAEIVAATGYRPRTIREIAQRYHESGAAALEDRRTRSQGAPPLLAPSLQHELWHALQNLPPSGGIWTGPKVAQWIAERTGKRVHRQRGWEYLRRLKCAGGPAAPTPRFQELFKQSLKEREP